MTAVSVNETSEYTTLSCRPSRCFKCVRKHCIFDEIIRYVLLGCGIGSRLVQESRTLLSQAVYSDGCRERAEASKNKDYGDILVAERWNFSIYPRSLFRQDYDAE